MQLSVPRAVPRQCEVQWVASQFGCWRAEYGGFDSEGESIMRLTEEETTSTCGDACSGACSDAAAAGKLSKRRRDGACGCSRLDLGLRVKGEACSCSRFKLVE